MTDSLPILSLVANISEGLRVTLFLTVVSFAVGAALALPLALMRTAKTRFLRWPALAVIDVSRAIPPLVWLLIIYFGLSPIWALDPIPAAVVGLSLISAGYLAENFRSGIENVHGGQKEAAAALGLTPANQFWRVIAPQAVNLALPPSASYAVALLKDTAIASIIGVTDVIFIAQLEVGRGTPAVLVFAIAGALYLVIGVPLSLFSRYVDKVIRKRVVVI